MTELVIKDVLGREFRLKRIGDMGYQVTIPNTFGKTTSAYLECGQAKQIMEFLQQQENLKYE